MLNDTVRPIVVSGPPGSVRMPIVTRPSCAAHGSQRPGEELAGFGAGPDGEEESGHEQGRADGSYLQERFQGQRPETEGGGGGFFEEVFGDGAAGKGSSGEGQGADEEPGEGQAAGAGALCPAGYAETEEEGAFGEGVVGGVDEDGGEGDGPGGGGKESDAEGGRDPTIWLMLE